MVDLFALVLTHGLLALAAWRLIQRADLDHDPAKAEPVVEEQTPEVRKPLGRGMRLK